MRKEGRKLLRHCVEGMPERKSPVTLRPSNTAGTRGTLLRQVDLRGALHRSTLVIAEK